MENIGLLALCGCCYANTTALCKSLLSRFTLSGVLIPPSCGKTFLLNNVDSENTVVIDCDPLSINEFDDEEKEHINESDKNLSVKINRSLFKKAKKVIDDLRDILEGCSKNITRVLLISSNYRLLKYLECKNIEYYIPAESLVTMLKETNAGFKTEAFEECKRDLQARKPDKLLIYSTLDGLVEMVSQTHGLKRKF